MRHLLSKLPCKARASSVAKPHKVHKHRKPHRALSLTLYLLLRGRTVCEVVGIASLPYELPAPLPAKAHRHGSDGPHPHPPHLPNSQEPSDITIHIQDLGTFLSLAASPFRSLRIFRLPINLKSKIFTRSTALVALAAGGPVDTFKRLRRDDQLWSHIAVSTPHCQPLRSTTGVATSTITKVRWLPSDRVSECSLQNGTCGVEW